MPCLQRGTFYVNFMPNLCQIHVNYDLCFNWVFIHANFMPIMTCFNYALLIMPILCHVYSLKHFTNVLCQVYAIMIYALIKRYCLCQFHANIYTFYYDMPILYHFYATFMPIMIYALIKRCYLCQFYAMSKTWSSLCQFYVNTYTF